MTRRLPAGVALFCVLCVAAAATAVAVLHFKTSHLALEVQHLGCRVDPGSKHHPAASIRFFTRYSDAHAEVSIVGPDLSPARVLSFLAPDGDALVAGMLALLPHWESRAAG